jgi:hypothetical protein
MLRRIVHNDPMTSLRRQWPRLILLAAFVCSAPLAAQTGARPVRVLFLGNSYTYVNNLPEMFARLADAGRHPVETDMRAPGGWRLEDHWNKPDDRAAVRDGHWDFVVLQDQSTLGVDTVIDGKARVTSDRVFRPSADRWATEIAAAGARTLFYLTWARRASPEDQAVLTDAYTQAAKANHALVVPVGIAWSEIRQTRPGLVLFLDDGSHPSPAGTYLAACTFYAAIFNANPSGLPSKISGTPVALETGLPDRGMTAVLVDLSPGDAAALQAAAWKAWLAVRQ